MATFISKLWNKISSKQPPLSVMIIGLDDSGKTSILNTLLACPAISSASASATVSTSKQTSDDDYNKARTSFSDLTQSPSSLASFTAALADRERFSLSVEPTIGYNYELLKFRGHTINLLDFSGQSRYRGLWQEFFNCVDGIVFVIDSSDLIRLVVVQDELETLLRHPFFATLKPDVPPKLSINITTNVNTQMRHVASQQFAQKQVVIEQGKLIQSPLSDRPRTSSQRDHTSSDSRNRVSSRTRIPILFMANKSDLATSADTQIVVEAVKLDQVPCDRHPWHIQATSVRTNQGIIEGFEWLINEMLKAN